MLFDINPISSTLELGENGITTAKKKKKFLYWIRQTFSLVRLPPPSTLDIAHPPPPPQA